MTPEGKVKKLVEDLLLAYDIQPAKKAGAFEEAAGWYFMPGVSGYGVKGIPDFLGQYKGFFWGIETKAPGKKPTGFQLLQIKAIQSSGGAVFVVDGEESLNSFDWWLRGVSAGAAYWFDRCMAVERRMDQLEKELRKYK